MENPYAAPGAVPSSSAAIGTHGPSDGARILAMLAHGGAAFGFGIVSGGLVYLLGRRTPLVALHGLQSFWLGVYSVVALLLLGLLIGVGALFGLTSPSPVGTLGSVLVAFASLAFLPGWFVVYAISCAGMIESVCGRSTLLPFVGRRAALRMATRR